MLDVEELKAQERRVLRVSIGVFVGLLAPGVGSLLIRWFMGKPLLGDNSLMLLFAPLLALAMLSQLGYLFRRDRRRRLLIQALAGVHVTPDRHGPLSTWERLRHGLGNSLGLLIVAVLFVPTWLMIAPIIDAVESTSLVLQVVVPFLLAGVTASVLYHMFKLDDEKAPLSHLERTYREAVRDRAELSGSLSLDANRSAGGLEIQTSEASGVVLDLDAQSHVEHVVEHVARKDT